MKNPIIITIIVALTVGATGFFAGTKYQQRNRQQFVQFQGGNGQFRGKNQGQNQNGGLVRGEVLSLSDKTLTVKLPDGSSKIVLFSDQTNIAQTTKGAVSDLKTGETVFVIGPTNSDGSVTAQNIQINPSTVRPNNQ